MTLALTLCAALLAAGEGEPLPPHEPSSASVDAPAVPPSVEADPERWPGEQKRFHFGLGVALHGGVMVQRGSRFLLLQSEVEAAFSIRLVRHDELRVHVGFAGGFPDVFGGETNVSYRHALNRRFAVGLGVFAYWGGPSYRLGLEVPFTVRFGATRRHELSVALRFHAGVFNDTTYEWYDFSKLAFAYAADVAVAYTFFF